MKKFTIILILMVVLLSGCSVVRINTKDIDSILNAVLTKSNNLYNQVGQGYKYYVPAGVTFIDNDEHNNILYCDGNYYYLYIDIVDYYYKTKINYKEKDNVYYSRKFDKKDGFKYSGYLEITEESNNMYHIDFVYNYSKVEALVDKYKLNESVLNISYILSTIKYNHTVIQMMQDENYFKNKTGKYNNYKTNGSSNKFKLKNQDKVKKDKV